MAVPRTTMLALTLSGALCGMAGSMLVFGSISHRMVTDGSLTGFTGSNGQLLTDANGVQESYTIRVTGTPGGSTPGGQ